jgi:hypothetical protein
MENKRHSMAVDLAEYLKEDFGKVVASQSPEQAEFLRSIIACFFEEKVLQGQARPPSAEVSQEWNQVMTKALEILQDQIEVGIKMAVAAAETEFEAIFGIKLPADE